MTVLPAYMYRDPMEAAMRAEDRKCNDCRHRDNAFGVEFCGAGRKELKKCWKYEAKRG